MRNLRDGFHHHVCPACWHVWSHDRSKMVEADVEAAHQCPACGKPWADGLARTESECRVAVETKVHRPADPFLAFLAAMLEA